MISQSKPTNRDHSYLVVCCFGNPVAALRDCLVKTGRGAFFKSESTLTHSTMPVLPVCAQQGSTKVFLWMSRLCWIIMQHHTSLNWRIKDLLTKVSTPLVHKAHVWLYRTVIKKLHIYHWNLKCMSLSPKIVCFMFCITWPPVSKACICTESACVDCTVCHTLL